VGKTGNLELTKIRDVPMDCRNRIADILEPNEHYAAERIANLKSQLRDRNTNNFYDMYLLGVKH
jgi:hypothetical protein